MKKMQPLDVIPMLGSFPVSPTSLNWNVMLIGVMSSEAPVLSVTKILGSSSTTGTGSGMISSSPKQPERETVAMSRASSTALVRMIEPVINPIMTLVDTNFGQNRPKLVQIGAWLWIRWPAVGLHP